MLSKDSLKEQFEELGVDPSEEVLDKCIEICSNNNQDDPVEFVEQWMAFSVSNLNGAEPTVQHLIEMENKEFKNHLSSAVKNDFIVGTSKNLKVYNQDSDEEENNILGAYVCLTPKADKRTVSKIQQQQHGTPDTSKNAFSPVTYSPLLTTKRPKVSSNKSGNVVYTFGNYVQPSADNKMGSKHCIAVNVAELNDGTEYLDSFTKYQMSYDTEEHKALANYAYNIGKQISQKILKDQKDNKNRTEDQSSALILSHCDELSQDNVKCLGQVFCRKDKLEAITNIFIGLDEQKSRVVQLNLTKMKQLNVIPGQVCILNGSNPRGKIFYAQDIYAERLLRHCPAPYEQMTETISVVIAAAPFTADDNLTFEYLDKLMIYCQSANRPNVLILTGAFLNVKSELIYDVATQLKDYFLKMMTGISEQLPSTEIIVVASMDDYNSSGVYPTRPYNIRQLTNVKFVADPSIVDINGVKIGLTSTDILKQIDDSEYCINAGTDKIRRYIGYLFHQKSFYPVYPPAMPTDLRSMYQYAAINDIPNILVVPSDMKYFMREVHKCLCINPGRLMVQNMEGTLARLTIQPPQSATSNINEYISGQIAYI